VIEDEAGVLERARVAGGELDRPLRGAQGFRALLLDPGSEDVDDPLDQVEAEERVGGRVARVELDRPSGLGEGVREALAAERVVPEMVGPLQQAPGVEVVRRGPARPRGVGTANLPAGGGDDRLRDLLLDGEEVGQAAVEGLRPDLGARLGVGGGRPGRGCGRPRAGGCR
jgi:hypothetical protein